MLFRFCEEYVVADQVVWDVGANVGIFAISAAQRGAKVFAIEPDPWLFLLLQATRNHSENEQLDVELHCAAIADQPGTARLAIAERGRASNYLEDFSGRDDAGGARSTCLVPVLTLDLLLRGRRPPALVKIDVEVAEAAVLMGATRLLSGTRPVILIEVGPTTRESVISQLDEANYRVSSFGTDADGDCDAYAAPNLIAKPN